ncbi:hypothetical protein FS837_009722 [Tulasnella sp. UAMH 9824]|nr:hypothetical protein FS837_009722 [Tulasnella sp. UAMH 9824]
MSSGIPSSRDGEFAMCCNDANGERMADITTGQAVEEREKRRYLSQKATPSLGYTIAEPEWYKNARDSPPSSTTMSTAHPTVEADAPVGKPRPSTPMDTEPPITSPPTQFSKSSPIRKGTFYAEHKLEQVQKWGYREETHLKTDFENADDLFEFLGTPDLKGLRSVTFDSADRKKTFFATANSMSKSIKKMYFKDPPNCLVVFKDTEKKIPRGHVTDTKCRPDITAALRSDFSGDDTTFWACIRMAGEWASKGTSLENQEKKAISYLHYLLLARPDLYVAQGMLASDDGILFLVGIGGFGIRRLKIRWDDEKLSKLLYAFIYRTYDPGHFADSSYTLDPIDDDRPTWTITIGVKSQVGDVTTERPVPCRKFLPHYASSPFETRTHVFVTQGEAVDIDGKKLRVLKDQVCRTGKRFEEHKIFAQLHDPKRVPGVVEAVYHKEIELPSQLEGLQIGRKKHRHGLRQVGMPFASIPTVKEMLQVAFDTVEVLRFLRVRKNILHRDISAGNVMYAPPSEDEQDPDASTRDAKGPVFSEYFLSKGRPQATSVLLVDFNHAKDLTDKTDPSNIRVARTGTPIFMARAVGLERALQIPRRDQYLAPMPSAPDQYVEHYQDGRLEKFPPQKSRYFIKGEDEGSAPWRHELDHDIESVFWLMLYWAMTAQPKGGAAEYIATLSWSCLTGEVKARQMLLDGFRSGLTIEGTFHSTFQPLGDLFEQLAEILCSVDRHWLPASDTRNDPEYSAEAFQRLILQFLIDHEKDGDESFMNQAIDSNTRELEGQGAQVPNSSTTNQRSHASSNKRASNRTGQSES